jgi:hypothetical protein
MSNKETLEEFIDEELEGVYFTNISKRKEVETLIELGAKWQQERSYSEEEVFELLKKFAPHIRYNHKELPHTWEQVVKEWFEQFKKK